MKFSKKNNNNNVKNDTELKRLYENEKRMADTAKELLDAVASLSSFDVNLSYISEHLMHYAGDLADLSASNLAIIEETSAGMNQANSSIDSVNLVLGEISETSNNLLSENQQGHALLTELVRLKDEVLSDTQDANVKINQLAELAVEIDKIVESVQGIANQTNLLALNAAIEAARAGEHGRGFAVVAEEVRKLADDTKENLSGMGSFVQSIRSAAEEGTASMLRTIASTNQMNQKMSVVAQTIEGNVEELTIVVNDIKNIHSSIQEIKDATQSINAAIEHSSENAEVLAEMAKNIHDDSSQSVTFAKTVSSIDDRISGITAYTYEGLSTGDHTLTNAEFCDTLTKAQEAHEQWLATLHKIVDGRSMLPLQTSSEKCAFGHFYQALPVTNPQILNEWQRIAPIHKSLHESGAAAIDAIKAGNMERAVSIYNEAEAQSRQIINLLKDLSSKVEAMTAKGQKIFE